MNSKTWFIGVLMIACAVLLACEDNGHVPPPPDPPQIETLASYFKTTDPQGRQNGLMSNDVYAFLLVSNGEFWIGSSTGIAKYPDLDDTTRPTAAFVDEISGLPNPKVRAMQEYNGKVYVATWGGGVGVYDVGAGTWTALRKATNGLRNNSVADVEVVPGEDRVYFATNEGVSIYNPTAGTFTSFIAPNLLDPLVSTIETRDNGGTLERWYGPRFEARVPAADADEHGITVSRAPNTVIEYTTVNSGLVEANVNDIYFDSVRGTFFVAYATQGIAEVNVGASTWNTHTGADGLPSSTVYAITRAGSNIWAATQNGLARLQGDGTWQGYRRGGGLQADRVRALYSPDGERLYLGFIEGGAARVDTQP